MRLLDYVGTVSFAMSGAATAGMRGMNLLGCVFVGVLAATGGGTLRDLLLGQTPVFWLVEVRLAWGRDFDGPTLRVYSCGAGSSVVFCSDRLLALFSTLCC